MAQFIGIEGGGTKFVCAYGSSPDDLQKRIAIPTRTPNLTLKEVIDYIHEVRKTVKIQAIGASLFGPLDLDRGSLTYGYMTTSPKLGWSNVDFVGLMRKEFGLPIGFDTDVNGAAIGEYRWGAARGIGDFIYLTVGTGIGGGVMVNHQLLHGAMHPELGHILIPQDQERDSFGGVCPYHKNCLEGLASGPSMKVRWKVKSALDLPEGHEAWDLEAHYLGVGLANYMMTLSPKRIIMGGGVMRQNHLLPKIRAAVIKSLGNYIKDPKTIGDMDNFIIKAELGEQAGVSGAIALAEQAWTNAQNL